MSKIEYSIRPRTKNTFLLWGDRVNGTKYSW